MDFRFLFQNNLLLILLAVWVLPWKGYALWKAARLGDKWWFVAILILNTLAVLDILYIFVFSGRRGFRGVAGEVAALRNLPEGRMRKGRKARQNAHA